jgi:hypothetical protein
LELSKPDCQYGRGALRGKKKQLELALEGSFTEYQRWMLQEALGHLDSLQAQIAARWEAQSSSACSLTRELSSSR